MSMRLHRDLGKPHVVSGGLPLRAAKTAARGSAEVFPSRAAMWEAGLVLTDPRVRMEPGRRRVALVTDLTPASRPDATLTAGSHASTTSSRRLQPALPKQMYVDQQHFAKERDLVLFDSWFCVGRLDDLGLARPGRLAVLDVVGE